MQDFDGEFKKLITEPTLTINDKGISQYEINSFPLYFVKPDNVATQRFPSLSWEILCTCDWDKPCSTP